MGGTKAFYIGNREGMIAPRVSVFGRFVRGRAGRNMRSLMPRREFGLIWSESNTLNPAPGIFLVENMRIAAACRQFCLLVSVRSL